MFALGCILYEITTGQKLFSDDWAIREYSTKAEESFPALWPPCEAGTRLYSLKMLASSLLQVNPFNRPGAEETYRRLALVRDGSPILNVQMPHGDNQTCTPSPLPQPAKVADVLYRRPYLTAWPPVSHGSHSDAAALRAPTASELEAMEARARHLGGRLLHPQEGGYHTLADYQNQIMVMEFQNRKRLERITGITSMSFTAKANSLGNTMGAI
jgi:serine/threonine protein kinase